MKKLPSFFAGALTMLLVMSLVVGASAYSGKVTKELEYRDIKVTLDGVELDLRDVQGNSVEPFIISGTNYLPVRALSEALGLTVSWDGSTNTVVLRTPEAIHQQDAYKALGDWIVRNRHSYSNGISMYAATSSTGNGSYALVVNNNGTILLMRLYEKSGVKLHTTITLSEDNYNHLFNYEAYMNSSSSTPTITGGGVILAEKLGDGDGFWFSAGDASEEQTAVHKELAQVSACDVLAFLDDIFTNQMKSSGYSIADFGFVRENIVGG